MKLATIIFETKHFVIGLPDIPHIDRCDGGHIAIVCKLKEYKTLDELPLLYAEELGKLAIICGQAMKLVLKKNNVNVEVINYQINGNWSIDSGIKRDAMHLHLYGRTRESKNQVFGEALYFPNPQTGFYKNFLPITYDECCAIRDYIVHNYEMKKKTKLGFNERAMYYNNLRRADPRLCDKLIECLNIDAGTIVDIGAGTGNYASALEQRGFQIIAVEPQKEMQLQNKNSNICWIQACAEETGLTEGIADGVIIVNAIHHFTQRKKSIEEIYRILKKGANLVVFTFDPQISQKLWFFDYWPMLREKEIQQYGSIDTLKEELEAVFCTSVNIENYTLDSNFLDGFSAAFWNKPECFFRKDLLYSSTLLSNLSDTELQNGLEMLAEDLKNGDWGKKYTFKGHMDVGCRIFSIKKE